MKTELTKKIQTKKIQTKLIQKEELFKTLFVAELSHLPLLLVGERGTGKTQAFLDYAKEDFFIRQLNYDTRAEDLLGWINLKKLKDGEIERINGIQNSRYILLDEIDKAPSSVRNLFLSVLREKVVFDGEKIIPCRWELLVGTTNKNVSDFEPDDVIFLDRFILRYKVNRIGIEHIPKLFNYGIEQEIVLKTKEVDQEEYTKSLQKIEHLVCSNLYSDLSDRTIAHIPAVLYAFMRVEEDVNQAIVQTLNCLVGNEKVVTLVENIGLPFYIMQAQTLVETYKKADTHTKQIIVSQMKQELEKMQKNISVDRKIVFEVKQIFAPYIYGESP